MHSSSKWGKVIKSVSDIGDVDELWQHLTKELSLAGERTSYNALRHAVDNSSKNLVDASRLHRSAMIHYERIERRISAELEELRMKTRRELVKDKAKIAGQLTQQMIEDQTMLQHTTKYEELSSELSELKAMTDTFRKLVDAWQSRSADLRSLFDKAHYERTNKGN